MANDNSKVAILIDGGFFKQRFKSFSKTIPAPSPSKKDVETLISDIMSKVHKKTNGTCKDVLLLNSEREPLTVIRQ